MITGPKYKIAKRLGAPVFEKTQTPKFALSKNRGGKRTKRRKQLSEYGRQLMEKQKMRYVYGLYEKQFSNYIAKATSKKGVVPSEMLYQDVELRLDNIVFRMGLAHTRALARQLSSHGHITVNGRKVTIPSYALKVGDKIAVREGSKEKKVFEGLVDKLANTTPVTWVKFDPKTLSGEVQGMPKQGEEELLFDITSVLEYYSR
ncbi:30S ribosomal protein S4 [Candidatus Wolfebacteria bacterium]|nr:MAG: 30S ribosomal protein S4 [Candidatus Wolfebacteria bacterium]